MFIGHWNWFVTSIFYRLKITLKCKMKKGPCCAYASCIPSSFPYPLYLYESGVSYSNVCSLLCTTWILGIKNPIFFLCVS